MDPQKKKKIISSLWASFQSALLEHLKGKLVKLALKKFLGTAAGGGFQAWLIAFVVEELFEQVAEPVVKAFFLKLGYLYNRHEGTIIIKKIREARENNDGQAYDHAVDDIFIE